MALDSMDPKYMLYRDDPIECDEHNAKSKFSSGQSRLSSGRSPANRSPEIPGALKHLDDQLGKLEELARQLEQRLCTVLRSARPEDGKKGTGFITSCAHGQTLRECGARAGTTAALLADILDRLEL